MTLKPQCVGKRERTASSTARRLIFPFLQDYNQEVLHLWGDQVSSKETIMI